MADEDRTAELEEALEVREKQINELTQMLEAATRPSEGVWIDGVAYVDDDLEFGEQRELREKVRELAPDDAAGDPDDMDFVPVLVWIVRRRTNTDYTLEEALKVKPRDLKKPTDPPSTGSETPVESGSPTT